ncbi:hypothetical protein GCM10010305_44950 [Streptomyces termitum]|uniref:Uncharacterized protein n=1 Tax=Streptomyces termitum TaxID=67368 RepID=A0A918WCC1_9ACTN|nr:hypothetical protein GCM10010305_44950 [Streptomyces termitum]
MDTEVPTALRARWTLTAGTSTGAGGRTDADAGTRVGSRTGTDMGTRAGAGAEGAAAGVCAAVAVAASALPAWRLAR